MGYALPVGFVVVAWWVGTGVVLMLDSLPRATYRWSLTSATLLACCAFYGLHATSAQATPTDAYLAFACALTLWGWQELAFLTGFVTGPRKSVCHCRCGGWRHFVHGCQAVLYHELSLIAAGLAVFALSWNGPNQTGAWTFAALWVMRQSAKLNLHLGARNLALEFLPEHLSHLACYFRRRRMNPLFPVSIAASSILLYGLIQNAASAVITDFDRTAYTLVAALVALGIVEHLFLMIPVPSTILWGRSVIPDAQSTTSDPLPAKPV